MALQVILADDRPVRRQRRAVALAALPGIALAGNASSLMEAYCQLESGLAGAVVLADGFRALPEYRMFADLAGLLATPVLPLGPEEEVSVLADRLARQSRATPAPASLRPAAAAPTTAAPLGSAEPVIVIGASTGGVEALHRVLGAFPADCPPTLVVQHIRGAFSAAFADRLDRACRPRIAEAADGTPLARGQVLVAPGDLHHLEIAGAACRLTDGPPVSGHRPSVDALFRSAVRLGRRVTGILLTGMGQDGARGLLEIRQAGGHTIAQDKASATVYGMPRVAAELGAAAEILPLDSIAGHALRAAARRPAAPAGEGT